MAKFKVITLSLSGKGNRIFYSGDVVSESDFPSVENVMQHVLHKGLHPLNEDGSEMERVILTQEMIDAIPEEQKAVIHMPLKPGLYTYSPSSQASYDHTVISEDIVNNPELQAPGIEEGDDVKISVNGEDQESVPVAKSASQKPATKKPSNRK